MFFCLNKQQKPAQQSTFWLPHRERLSSSYLLTLVVYTCVGAMTKNLDHSHTHPHRFNVQIYTLFFKLPNKPCCKSSMMKSNSNQSLIFQSQPQRTYSTMKGVLRHDIQQGCHVPPIACPIYFSRHCLHISPYILWSLHSTQ